MAFAINVAGIPVRNVIMDIHAQSANLINMEMYAKMIVGAVKVVSVIK